MQSPRPTHLTAAALLECLRAEERLLGDARAALTDLHAALRRGDPAALAAAAPRQEQLAAALADAETARAAATRDLAAVLGLRPDGLTLASLAARLPEPWAAELLAARSRLAAIAAESAEVRRRNANLVGHLRSYFRGVLSAPADADAPLRYGPSGGRLVPASGAVVQARG